MKQDTGNSFTDTVAFYMMFNGLNIDQAISKAESDLHGAVPEQVKVIARKELQDIGRVK